MRRRGHIVSAWMYQVSRDGIYIYICIYISWFTATVYRHLWMPLPLVIFKVPPKCGLMISMHIYFIKIQTKFKWYLYEPIAFDLFHVDFTWIRLALEGHLRCTCSYGIQILLIRIYLHTAYGFRMQFISISVTQELLICIIYLTHLYLYIMRRKATIFMMQTFLSLVKHDAARDESQVFPLIHHARDKMAVISQTIFLDAFSWMKSLVFSS